MSIILALTSTRDGIVASDGRRFHSVNLVNGVATEPACVATDTFNKTFSLNDGKVVGAFCGLLEFSGATVGEHITDITSDIFSSDTTFLSIVDHIEHQLKNRLNEIDNTEVILPSRNIDLLLVGGSSLTRANMKIASIRFYAECDGVAASREVVPGGKTNLYYAYGDGPATTAATRLLRNNRAPNRDADFLLKLAKKAIKSGIRMCGSHPHGTERACGGQVFTERTRY